MNKSLITALCAAILLTCGSLHATAIYDSTPWASAGVDPIAYSGPLYSSFSTVGFAGQLTRVGLILQGVNTSTGSITVDLFEDSGSNSVGAHLANIGSIEDSSFADSELLALVVLTAGETPLLAPDTRYWLGLTGNNTSGRWSYTTDSTGAPVAGEFYVTQGSTGATVYANSGYGAYQMSLDVVAPEPSSGFLVGPALALLALLRRRRV